MTRDEVIKVAEVARRNATHIEERALPGRSDLVQQHVVVSEGAWLVAALDALGVLKLDHEVMAAATDADLVPLEIASGKDLDRWGERYGLVRAESDDCFRRRIVAEVLPQEARCEPPPEHRGKRWHWLHHPQEGIVAWRLKTMIKEQKTLIKGWGHPINRSITFSIVAQAERGWRYIAPCEEPASERGDEVTE